MQYKILSAVLLATVALAAPAPDTSDYPTYPGMDIIYDDVPSSILSVLETAIPTTWIEAIYTDPAFRSEEANAIMHGTYPAWYNSLPQSVKDWGTSAAMADASDYSSYSWSEVPHPTPLTSPGSGSSTSGVSSTLLSVTDTASTSTATATETTTKGGSSGSAASSSASGTTSISTAGAPAATGGVAIGLAGAAGILGLAIAL